MARDPTSALSGHQRASYPRRPRRRAPGRGTAHHGHHNPSRAPTGSSRSRTPPRTARSRRSCGRSPSAPRSPRRRSSRKAIHDRERILSTGIGQGIAIPHAKIASVTKFVAAIGISKTGVDFDSLDDKPAHIIVMIAGPEGQSEEYLRILSRFTAVLKNEQVRNRVIEAKKSDQVMAILRESR